MASSTQRDFALVENEKLEKTFLAATRRASKRVQSCIIIKWVIKICRLKYSRLSALLAGFIMSCFIWCLGWLINRLALTPISFKEAKGLIAGSVLAGLSYWIIDFLHDVTLKMNRMNLASLPEGGGGFLAMTEWFESRFSVRSQTICSFVVAVLAVVSAEYLLKGLTLTEGNWGFYATIFLGMFAVGNGVYCCLKCPTLVSPLTKHPIKLYPYDPANTISLQALMSIFGKLSLGCGFVVTVIMLLMSFVRPWQDQAKMLIGLTWLILGWGAVTYCFVFPFFKLSKAIRLEKQKQLKQLDKQIRSCVRQGEYGALSKDDLETLKKLIELRDFIFKTKNSPIDTVTLRNYISSLILPLASFFVANRSLLSKLFKS